MCRSISDANLGHDASLVSPDSPESCDGRASETKHTVDAHPAAYFSPAQIEAARAILGHYAESKHWVILLAQMQSGKTDAYMLVAFELLRLRRVHQVVIMAGFHDKELVMQLKDLTPSLASFQAYMEHDLHLPADERARVVQGFTKRFHILCGAELRRTALRHTSDTLFIWDESHYAQNIQNRPFHFLHSVDLSADGEPHSDVHNRLFLSVSATPFSEVCDAMHENQPKPIVKMSPGDGYVGVGWLYRNANIQPVNNWCMDLALQLQRQQAEPTPMYSIVRIRGEAEMAKAVEIAVASGVEYEMYDAQHKHQARRTNDWTTTMPSLSALATPPSRHKVVFIRGMLRMGKRIPKDHIHLVMETSRHAKTDVMLQGLLGRMCGYHTNRRVRIYVGQNLFKKGNDGRNELERYIQMMEPTPHITAVPRCASNLIGVCGGATGPNPWFNAHPIVMQPPPDDAEETADDRNHALYAKERLIRHVRTSLDNPHLQHANGPEQMAELLEQVRTIPLERWNLHYMQCVHGSARGTVHPTYAEMPQLMHAAVTRRVALSAPAGCGFGSNQKTMLNLWCFNTSQFAHLGFPRGTLVLHGRTKATGADERRRNEMARNVPQTSRREVFTRTVQPHTTRVTSADDADTGDANDPWSHPDRMRRYLDHVLGASTDPFGTIDATAKGITVDAIVLHQLGKTGALFHYIKAKYHRQLVIVRKRGRQPQHLQPTGKVRIAKLEWK